MLLQSTHCLTGCLLLFCWLLTVSIYPSKWVKLQKRHLMKDESNYFSKESKYLQLREDIRSSTGNRRFLQILKVQIYPEISFSQHKALRCCCWSSPESSKPQSGCCKYSLFSENKICYTITPCHANVYNAFAMLLCLQVKWDGWSTYKPSVGARFSKSCSLNVNRLHICSNFDFTFRVLSLLQTIYNIHATQFP